MQDIFGKMYPLVASASFAALAAFYACFHESPDQIALVLLSVFGSLGWLCFHGAETLLLKLVIVVEGTTQILEEILKEEKDK